MGHELPSDDIRVWSAHHPITDIGRTSSYGRDVPTTEVSRYSISSSASNCIEGAAVSPRVWAVFILTINSNFDGCSTGSRLRPSIQPSSRSPCLSAVASFWPNGSVASIRMRTPILRTCSAGAGAANSPPVAAAPTMPMKSRRLSKSSARSNRSRGRPKAAS
jgi:hypothetical protein